jgi:hypothetical protein
MYQEIPCIRYLICIKAKTKPAVTMQQGGKLKDELCGQREERSMKLRAVILALLKIKQ